MAMPPQSNPKAFITWAHREPGWQESRAVAWAKEVYTFAVLLRGYGIDVDLDLFHQSEPGIDWTRFGPLRIRDAVWVIVVLSSSWRERWEGRNAPTVGAGAVAETDVLRSIFGNDQREFRRKVVLVTLPSCQDEDLVPDGLDGVHRFTVRGFEPEQIMPLVRLLAGRPAYPAGPLGLLPELPPVQPVAPTQDGSGHSEYARETMREVTAEVTHELAAPGQPRRAAAEPHSGQRNVAPALDPLLLQGRLYPYMYMPAIDSTEKAFCVRSVAALRLPQDQDASLASDDEQRLKAIVSGSTLNTWLAGAISRHPTPATAIGWRSIFPTTSTVITLQHRPVELLFGGWTIEARVGYNLRPYGSTGAAGMTWINVDVALRPLGPPVVNRWPLSLEDLCGLISAELSSLLDDGLASTLSDGHPAPGLLAVATVMVTTGARLGDFVLLMRPSWHQAEGSIEPLGGEWALRDYLDVDDRVRRQRTVRGWIKRLLRDAGVSGHEKDVDQFAPH